MIYRRPRGILILLLALLLSACAAPGSTVRPEDRKKAQASRNLGEAYLSEGNYTEALRELLKAEKINPKDPILLNDLGLAYMAKDRLDTAITYFKRAIELKPDYSLAKNNLGGAYLVLKEWDKAIPPLKEVTGDMLYATPHFPLANLGWAYYNKGDYAKAREYLTAALELKPDFLIAQLNLGRTELASGHLYQALSIFENAAKDHPKDPVLLLELGRTYRLMGRYDDAKLALKAAMDLTDDSKLAAEAAEEMNKIYR